MNRYNASHLSAYLDLKDPFDVIEPSKDPQYEEDVTQLKQILDEIFSVNPDTGLPNGDISYFLSPAGNPQVKEWLEQNLLQPRSKDTGSSLQDVSDDLIAECSRKHGESYFDYSNRLRSIYESATKDLESLKSD